MKILNFGSLNIDIVYAVEHIVKPGETISAPSRALHAGGKGLNQSIAAARAGAQVIHAGNIGGDGAFLAELLQDAGANVSHLRTLDAPSGHAVIQVDKHGQNSIRKRNHTAEIFRRRIHFALRRAEPRAFPFHKAKQLQLL